MRDECVLVTGCAGFIGYHVTKRFLQEGHYVIGIDNLNSYYDTSLKKTRLSKLNQLICLGELNFFCISLEDSEQVEQIFSEYPITTVIHLAAQAGVRYSLENPHAYIDSNITGFLNVLEGCKNKSIKKLMYASSSSVYGENKKVPFSVLDRVDKPMSLYAVSKRTNELMAQTYSQLYEIPMIGLRFFTVYGPWGRPDMAYFMFTRAILEGEPIKVFNHGKLKRDFTYIDDVVEGIYRLKVQEGKREIANKIYNIGNNKPENLLTFISTLEKKLNKVAVKEYLPHQTGDVYSTYADVSELIQDVGFSPDTKLEFGIGKFIDWYKKYYDI